MKIFYNFLIVLLLIFLCAQISFSSEQDCAENEPYSKGYQATLHDISKGNWRYKVLGLSKEFMVRHDSIQKEAGEYGLSVGIQDEFIFLTKINFVIGKNTIRR